MSAISSQQIKEWRSQIKQARCEHQHTLRTELKKIESNGSHKKTASLVNTFKKKLEKSVALVNELKASKIAITFPEQLPISQRQAEIAQLINDNQIVVVAGETGSGKTTQLPKICLSLGFGKKGLIAHTQPCLLYTSPSPRDA